MVNVKTTSSASQHPGVITPRRQTGVRQRTRIRLIVSIPVITSLPLLVVGLLIRDMDGRFGALTGQLSLKPVMTVIALAGVVALMAGVALAYAVTSRLVRLTVRSGQIAAGNLPGVVATQFGEDAADEIEMPHHNG